jgi:hypothetical protein
MEDSSQSKVLKHNLTNIFIEELEQSLQLNEKINDTLSFYYNNEQLKNFYIEIEFELVKLNLKYLSSILSCFIEYKTTDTENHQIKMLKLYDFTVYEFKRLRNKYEDLNEFYFSLDEECKYIRNIKTFMESEILKPSRAGYLYIKMLNYYLKKFCKRIIVIRDREFKAVKEEIDKFSFLVKIYLILIYSRTTKFSFYVE